MNPMLGKLAPGDVVTVTRIDRLARSTFDLFKLAPVGPRAGHLLAVNAIVRDY